MHLLLQFLFRHQVDLKLPNSLIVYSNLYSSTKDQVHLGKMLIGIPSYLYEKKTWKLSDVHILNK